MTVMTGVIAWVTIEVAAPFQHTRLPPAWAMPHAIAVKFRARSPRQTSHQKKPPTERMDKKCQGKRQATSRSCGDRVTPVSQYADALWETSCGCVLYSSSGRLAITVPRHNRDIMVARRIISSGRAGKLNAGRFCSLTAGIREHCSLSLRYISTAQEDVLCGDHNGVAPKRH